MHLAKNYCSLLKSFFIWLICTGSVFSQTKNPKATLVSQGFILNNPPFAACHASTIVSLPDKSLLAAWFGGAYESSPDVCIWIARKEKNQWRKPEKVADGIINDTLRYPCWNPVLFRSNAGKLFLFYKVGKSPREWWGMVKYSSDNGQTWSAAEKLPDGMLGPIKNKPEQLPNGDILYPSSSESLDEKVWSIHLEKTDSEGKNWQKISIDCDTFGVIQPSILVHADKRLQLICRSRQNKIVQTWSGDNGVSWAPLSTLDLPNPNSGTDAVTLRNGTHVLVYNPLVKGETWSNGRYKLNVAVSKDGIHWADVYKLENETKGEFSYPAVIQSADGLVHITYTHQRKNIKHVVLKMD